MKFYLILIAIVASLLAATIPIPGTDVWYSQYVSVLLFGFLLVATFIGEMSLSLGLFFAYITFSTVFIANQDSMAVICLAQLTVCLLTAKAISNFNAGQRQKVWVMIGALLSLQVIWGILQYFNLDPLFKLTTNTALCDTVGFNGSHNQYGLFLAGAAVTSFIVPFTIPFVLVALILSKTLSTLVGAVVAGVFFFRKKLSKPLIILSVVICIAAFFLFTRKDVSAKLNERMAIWKLTIGQVVKGKAYMIPADFYLIRKVVPCNPVFGFGFQKFFTISPYTQKPVLWHNNRHVYEHAHNDYVEAFFDLGYIGIILLSFVLLEIFFLYRSIALKTVGLEMSMAGLIAFAVSALSIYAVHTAYNGFFLCVLLGLFYGEVRCGQKR